MDKSLADFALRYIEKRGASYVESKLESHETTHILMKNGTIEATNYEKSVGIGMRYLMNKTLGFVSINESSKEKIKQAIQKSIRLTKKAEKIKEPIDLSHEKIYRESYKVKPRMNPLDISPEEKIKVLQEGEKAILSTKIKTPGRYLVYLDDVTKKYLVTSEGAKIESTIPRVDFYYVMTVKEGSKTSQRYWQYGVAKGIEILKEWNIPKILTDEVKSLSLALKKGKPIKSGKYDFVVGPQVTGIMVHESVGHPYEADRIFGREAAQAGESFINTNMIGTRVGSDTVTIVDDPTLENSFGYYLFDDEGVKARRKVLMKNGIITELLHNRETAVKMGLQSNGAARSTDFDKEPIVRMSNTMLLPGKYTQEELIEGVKEGIFMKNFTEWNIDDKRYQQKYVGSECYLIKNGKLLYPVLKPTLEITTPALWSSIDAVGKDFEGHAGTCGKGEPLQACPVWFGGASIRLRGINLR